MALHKEYNLFDTSLNSTYKEILSFTDFDSLEDAFSLLQNDNPDSLNPPETRSLSLGDLLVANENDCYNFYSVDSFGFEKLSDSVVSMLMSKISWL